MAPTITSEKITLTYPVFAADFLDQNRLLVAGGGGEGRSGVGNKITLLDVSQSTIKQSDTETAIVPLSEIELSKNEDACMSLAVARQLPAVATTATVVSTALVDESLQTSKSRKKKKKLAPASATSAPTSAPVPAIVAFAGVNSAESDQLTGKNEHFRVFSISADSDSSIVPISRTQHFSPSKETETYQRVLRTKGSFTAFASGGGLSNSGSELVVIFEGSEVLLRIKTTSEVADLDLSDDGKLTYGTGTNVFVTSLEGDRQSRKLEWQPSGGALRSLRWISNTRIAIVLNLKQRTGAELCIIEVSTSSVVARRTLHKGIKAVTSLDTIDLSAQQALAVAGADQSIEILTFDVDAKLRSMKTIRDVHPFQISKIAFSPPPEPSADAPSEVLRLATTSIGNTVVVFALPLSRTEVKSAVEWRLLHPYSAAKQTAISVLLSLVAVVVFAVILQVVFVQRVGLQLAAELDPVWENFKAAARVGTPQQQKAGQNEMEGLLKGMEGRLESNPFGIEQQEATAIAGEIVTGSGAREPSDGYAHSSREQIHLE